MRLRIDGKECFIESAQESLHAVHRITHIQLIVCGGIAGH